MDMYAGHGRSDDRVTSCKSLKRIPCDIFSKISVNKSTTVATASGVPFSVIYDVPFKLQAKALVLLSVIATIEALPIANVHVKFVSRPHVYEHGITTDGDRTIFQKSFVSIGRRSIPSNSQRRFGERLRVDDLQQISQIGKYAVIKPENAESLWPVGVFLPPINVNDLGLSSRESGHITPDYSNGLEYHDPLLLTGSEAMMAVKYLYGRGELFYDDFPHVRAILRNQEERRQNGLSDNILHSLRPTSPFYKRPRF